MDKEELATVKQMKEQQDEMVEKIKNICDTGGLCLCPCEKEARNADFAKRLDHVETKLDEQEILLRSFSDSEDQTESSIEQIKEKTKQFEADIEELRTQILAKTTNKSSNKGSNQTQNTDSYADRSPSARETKETKEPEQLFVIHKQVSGATSETKNEKKDSKNSNMPVKTLQTSKPLSETTKERRRINNSNIPAKTVQTTKLSAEPRPKVREVNSSNESSQPTVAPEDGSKSLVKLVPDTEVKDTDNESMQLVPATREVSRHSLNRNEATQIVRRSDVDMESTDPKYISKHICVHQTERRTCLDFAWQLKMVAEKGNVPSEDHFKLDTVQSVLLVDTSGSMFENYAWVQTCGFVHDYLRGIEEMAAEHNMTMERVALVTFGRFTTVVKHLTFDMDDVRRAFDALELGGPSPLFGGLIMGEAAFIDRNFDANGMPVYPKIILITDGKPTDTCLVEGPDICDPRFEVGSKSRILSLAENMSSLDLDVFCIPVGEEDNAFLDLFVEMSDGIKMSHREGRTLARRLYLTMEIARQRSQSPLLFDLLGNFVWDMEHQMMVMRVDTEADRQEKEKIFSRSKRKERDSHQRIMEEIYRDTNDPKLPSVGSRVRRGPDCDPEDIKDDDGPGTVTGHSSEGGHLVIYWDKTDKYEKLSYGKDDKFEVIIVDEPRKVTENIHIAVGCTVIPGKDWKPSDKFPNHCITGVILRCIDEGSVQVKWENGVNEKHSCSPENEEVVLLRDNQSSMNKRAIAPMATSGPRRNKNKNLTAKKTH